MFSHARLEHDKKNLLQSGYFDATWYTEQYADVAMTGLDPAEHFLRYGSLLNRDPGPVFSTSFYRDTHPAIETKNTSPVLFHYHRKGSGAPIDPESRAILWAASRMASQHGHKTAANFATRYLPPDLQYTADILQANSAISNERIDEWLGSLNTYLEHYALAPIQLTTGTGSLMSRLSSAALPKRADGPTVSVIMPVWNAKDTIRHAAQSILNQTWQPLELLIVDDASSDGTWSIICELASIDDRVKIMRNSVNTGPYVAKNIALTQAQGDYVTGQDADDWAHPQRIEKHIDAVMLRGATLQASLTYMIRMQPDGIFGHIDKVSSVSFDGVARKASISCLFEREFLTKSVGFWDSVRFGADSEMIARTQTLSGKNFAALQQIGMICLDLETSLTNHPNHGVDKNYGVAPIRANYRNSWKRWHMNKMNEANAYLPFPQKSRRYEAAEPMVVKKIDIQRALRQIEN